MSHLQYITQHRLTGRHTDLSVVCRLPVSAVCGSCPQAPTRASRFLASAHGVFAHTAVNMHISVLVPMRVGAHSPGVSLACTFGLRNHRSIHQGSTALPHSLPSSFCSVCSCSCSFATETSSVMKRHQMPWSSRTFLRGSSGNKSQRTSSTRMIRLWLSRTRTRLPHAIS